MNLLPWGMKMIAKPQVSFKSLAFLVVSHHESRRDLLRLAVEAYQAEDVEDAASVAEAMQVLRTFVPDIVLTEMSLHTDGGTGVVRPFRAVTGRLRPTTAVIVFTNRPIEKNVLRAMRAGVDDILRWPFSAQFLSGRIGRALVRRSSPLPAPRLAPDPAPREAQRRLPKWPDVSEVAVRVYPRATLTPDEVRVLTKAA